MAIQADLPTVYGFIQTNAYIKINNFNGNKDFINFDVLIYASEQSRLDGATHLEQLHFQVPYTDGAGIAGLYAYLKTQEPFLNAVDVI